MNDTQEERSGQWSHEEMLEILRKMQEANIEIYYYMFRQGFGGTCHAFLEFCGLMSVFTDICRDNAMAGRPFPSMNVHSGEALHIAGYQVEYIAEKFECIFGPFFKSNPEAAKAFAKTALGLDVDDGGEGKE